MRATVDSNDKANSLFFSDWNELGAHAIAIGKAIWEHNGDMLLIYTGENEGLLHKGAGGDAISVVISVNEDFLPFTFDTARF